MSDPGISCYKDEFERFHDLLTKQIDICPEELWTKKVGGYIYWQQLFHVFACIEIYALPDGQVSSQTLYPPEVVMFSQEPEVHMTKQQLKDFASKMKKMAVSFIESMSMDKLLLENSSMSKRLKSPKTNQNALIALIRHANYHLGSCDAILRQHGIPGVY